MSSMEASVTSSSRKRAGPSQETPDSKKVRQEGSAVKKIIPKQFFGNHLIWKEEGGDWMYGVEAVIVEEEENKENKKYSLLHQTVDEVQLRPLAAQVLSFDQTPVPTTRMDSFSKYAAQVIVEYAGKLFPCGGHVQVKQRTREAIGTGEADSDDEQIKDPPIPPAFTAEELYAVNIDYQRLRAAFESALCCDFGNAAGKFFFLMLGNFVLHLPATTQYSSYISTNPHGLYQPGSATLMHSSPARHTRASACDAYTRTTVERVADYAMYNHHTGVYTIVGEIKSNVASAENQNIEQMFALMRKQQTCMLGFTCHPNRIELRVLQREHDEMILCALPDLSLEPDYTCRSLRKLTELFIAFTTFINTVE